ncbi:MAG: HAD-IIIC family phosphatase [Clostridia bacterium]|nr:HAD-IIIC family phosphatase [Clostridia bacterium]
MHSILKYPFDPQLILKKRRSIKRELLADGSTRIHKKIAVLGGSTTHDIIDTLQLFLLDYGIEPEFYESEFGLFYEDAMFGTELSEFGPDLIFIHTSNRNITEYPKPGDSEKDVDDLLTAQYSRFEMMWDRLSERFACPVIQNNFEMPFYRLLGNRDAWDFRGKTSFITRLNQKFYEYASSKNGFYINDINYLSADYGLLKWSDPLYWHMYKYCLCLDAIPAFAFNVANIIKSIYGKNKKALVLDLDNTLWGGIVGDDGVDGIEIGHETSMGQVYSEFQNYLKELKGYGYMLNVNSKNDEENAIAGLNHPEGTLKPDDFICIKANWNPKDINFTEIAQEINIMPDSMVFVDDNPAERAIVTAQVPGVIAPAMDAPEHYITAIDRYGFFEATEVSKDDLTRNDMYKQNAERAKLQKSFANYEEYLLSLEMRAQIKPFETVYLSRITQLTNKSNQFNLTTKRYELSELQDIVENFAKRVYLYKVRDCFGDYGIVAVIIVDMTGDVPEVEEFAMSCRIMGKNVEYALLQDVERDLYNTGFEELLGRYIPTAKNKPVEKLYEKLGYVPVGRNGVQPGEVYRIHLEDCPEREHYVTFR